MPDPSLLPDLPQEQAYTAHVQQLLWAVIEESQRFSEDRMSDIYSLLADAWDELRLKPTNVSTQEMESLRLEVNRYLARKSLTDNQARRVGADIYDCYSLHIPSPPSNFKLPKYYITHKNQNSCVET